LDTAPEEPRETSTPRKIDTAWKAGELKAGRYGTATMTRKITISRRRMRKVGRAHSLSKPAIEIRPTAMPVNTISISRIR